MTACISCNAPLTDTDHFCPQCGKPVEPAIETPVTPLHCSNCGALLEEGAKFCGECGHAVAAVKRSETAGPSRISTPPKSLWATFSGNRRYLVFILIGLVVASLIVLFLTHHVNPSGRLKTSEMEERAKKGDANAQFELARMHHDGQGVKQDYGAAADWFERAAKQNDVRAEFNLGLVYLNGLGRERSESQAVTWLKAAADRGYAPAETTLGMLYKQGTGVTRDDAQGAAWLLKAARQGDADAQSLLGSIYVAGDGIPQNYVEGYRWLTLAGRNGDADASSQAEAITKVMSLEQLTAAIELAKQPAATAADTISGKVASTAPSPAPAAMSTPSSSLAEATQTPAPSTPIPSWASASPPAAPEDLSRFVKEQWEHTRGNNAYEWSRDFSRDADYCFVKGHPSDLRSFIAQDRTKFVERWPTRTYSAIQIDSKIISSDSARVIYNYDYLYRGNGRSARGHCRQVLMIEKLDSQWQITKFDEQVDRY